MSAEVTLANIVLQCKVEVERSGGMDRTELEQDVEGGGPCGLEKRCQLCCPNGLHSLWQFKIPNDSRIIGGSFPFHYVCDMHT